MFHEIEFMNAKQAIEKLNAIRGEILTIKEALKPKVWPPGDSDFTPDGIIESRLAVAASNIDGVMTMIHEHKLDEADRKESDL